MMKTTAKQHQRFNNAGFAIIVVLSSLLILTTLFAIASQRSMSHLQTQGAELYLARQQHEDAAILSLLRDMGAEAATSDNLTLPAPFANISVRLQDVGGLIDLNTASPALLERMFVALGFPGDAAVLLREWRDDGQRLKRLDNAVRISGADRALAHPLQYVATVHSGRRGVAPAIAPDAVLAIATDSDEAAPSSVNFAVYRDGEGQASLMGVISLGQTTDRSRVLELR